MQNSGIEAVAAQGRVVGLEMPDLIFDDQLALEDFHRRTGTTTLQENPLLPRGNGFFARMGRSIVDVCRDKIGIKASASIFAILTGLGALVLSAGLTGGAAPLILGAAIGGVIIYSNKDRIKNSFSKFCNHFKGKFYKPKASEMISEFNKVNCGQFFNGSDVNLTSFSILDSLSYTDNADSNEINKCNTAQFLELLNSSLARAKANDAIRAIVDDNGITILEQI